MFHVLDAYFCVFMQFHAVGAFLDVDNFIV